MPNTLTYEGVGGLLLFLAMAVLAIYFYGRYQRDIGYEEGRGDQYTALGELAEMAELADREQAELDARHAGRSTGRHAAGTMPRRELAPPLNLNEQPPWYREIPGPDRIQPGRDSGAGTVTMTRIPGPATDTGAFRAASEEDIAQRSADNAAWLEKWSAGAAS